jgi:hypothetical protein
MFKALSSGIALHPIQLAQPPKFLIANCPPKVRDSSKEVARTRANMAILGRALALLSVPLVLVSALKFDLHAVQPHDAAKHERCIRNFVAKEQLVVVTAILDGYRGDGQTVNMHIRDAMGNDYHRPKDVYGENRFAFTSHADSAFDVCFESSITGSMSPTPARVTLSVHQCSNTT